MSNQNQERIMAQMHRAFQLFAQNVSLPEEHAMEIVDIYPAFVEKGKKYLIDEVFKWGLNSFGETQLWITFNEYTTDGVYTPDQLTSFFKKLGYKDDVPIWTQPLGYTDAYDIGDIVSHNDQLWKCTEGNSSGAQGLRNTFEPGVWGWTLYVA